MGVPTAGGRRQRDRGPAGAGCRQRRRARSSGRPARGCAAPRWSSRACPSRTGTCARDRSAAGGPPADIKVGGAGSGPPQPEGLGRPGGLLRQVLDLHPDDRPAHDRCVGIDPAPAVLELRGQATTGLHAHGAAAFLALRPLTMEGFDASGTWISISRPLDPYALATAIILAALLGTIVMRLLPEV